MLMIENVNSNNISSHILKCVMYRRLECENVIHYSLNFVCLTLWENYHSNMSANC